MTVQPSQPCQEEHVSFGGSVGMQQPQRTHLGGIHSYRAAFLHIGKCCRCNIISLHHFMLLNTV